MGDMECQPMEFIESATMDNRKQEIHRLVGTLKSRSLPKFISIKDLIGPILTAPIKQGYVYYDVLMTNPLILFNLKIRFDEGDGKVQHTQFLH